MWQTHIIEIKHKSKLHNSKLKHRKYVTQNVTDTFKFY